MRLMSFSMTTPQILARTKTVTRRLGWRWWRSRTRRGGDGYAFWRMSSQRFRVLFGKRAPTAPKTSWLEWLRHGMGPGRD